MKKLAKSLGYANSSSYQRYENAAEYTREHLPLPMVKLLLDVLVGKGVPPITREEILMLAGLTELSEVASKTFERINTVPVIGIVETGKLKRSFELPQSKWDVAADASGDTTKVAKYGASVGDDSFSEFHIIKGGVAMFFKLADIGGQRMLSDGSLVIVLRRHGDAVEALVMEFVRGDGDRCALYFADPGEVPIVSDVGGRLPDGVEIFGLIFHSTSPHRERKPLNKLMNLAATHAPILASTAHLIDLLV